MKEGVGEGKGVEEWRKKKSGFKLWGRGGEGSKGVEDEEGSLSL